MSEYVKLYTNICTNNLGRKIFMENINKTAALGIDIGSTTVKVAILDEDHNILFSDYERHYANIRETLSSLLYKAYRELGSLSFQKCRLG